LTCFQNTTPEKLPQKFTIEILVHKLISNIHYSTAVFF